MNKIMYILLAAALLFLMVCLGIRVKDEYLIKSPENAEAPEKTEEEKIEDARPVIEGIIRKSEKEIVKGPTPINAPALTLPGIRNLVRNSSANQQKFKWSTAHGSEIEFSATKNPHFVVRQDASFGQPVELRNAAGQFAVVALAAASDRVNADKKDPSGLPMLRTYFIDKNDPGKGPQCLIALTMDAKKAKEWGTIGLVTRVPANNTELYVELHQAGGKTPRTGSASRFDDVCVFLARDKSVGNRILQAYIKQAKAFPR